MGRKRLTLEEIKERLIIINPNVEIIGSDYKSVMHKILTLCKVCGRTWAARYTDLHRGTGCPYCARNIKLDIHYVKTKMLEINENIEILSEEYIGNSHPLNCRCKVCGNEWSTSWSNLQNKTGCKSCVIENRKLTLEKVKEMLYKINRNIVILSNEYHGSAVKLLCKCKLDDHEWMASWDNLKQGKGCPKCGVAINSRENHWKWNSELTDKEREDKRLDPQNALWRNTIFENNNYTCELCGKIGGVLNAHHKDGYHWCKERRLDLTNGVCLCEDCHNKFHTLYGKKHNTEQQWLEFYESHKTKTE